MRIAIMQPYLFPYLGYFQLIRAVDRFVLLDDVAFIQKGWINRNNLLIEGQAKRFTVPLVKASQNKLIKDLAVSTEPRWRDKLLTTIEMAYRKRPYFQQVFPVVSNILKADNMTISGLVLYSLERLMPYLGLNSEVKLSSGVLKNNQLRGQDRVVEICVCERASHYINPAGGAALYGKEAFERHGLRISFLRPVFPEYRQGNQGFVPGLSVIDVMMNNSPEMIREQLDSYIIE